MAIALAMLGVLALAAAGGRAAARGTTGKPKLRLVRADPLTVTGTGFAARHHVRLTLSAQRDFVRSPLAGASGSFTVSFPTVVDRCTAWSVAARQGAVSIMLRGPKPECAPASTP